MSVTACSTWRQVPVTDAASVAAQRPVDVRLHLVNGSAVDLRRAQVRGDSVVGESTVLLPSTSVSVALVDIEKLEARQFSPGRTTALLTGVAATGLALFVAIVGYMASTAAT